MPLALVPSSASMAYSIGVVPTVRTRRRSPWFQRYSSLLAGLFPGARWEIGWIQFGYISDLWVLFWVLFSSIILSARRPSSLNSRPFLI
jgi:hypothetical protein